jgi:adenylate kinase
VRIVLVGSPGSGKGTQAALLARDFNVPHISSGDLLREAAKSNTSAGPEIARELARGDLVPDDVVLATVRDAVGKALASGGFVLEGFPRTVTQARRAEPFLAPDAVVHLDVPDDVAHVRLARRAREGRADDTEREIIERRLRHFHDEVGPILQHYRDRGILVTVDADRSPDDVHRDILNRFDNEHATRQKLSRRAFE